MDYEKYQSFGQMPLTPDVLIIPSELRYFVKVQNSCFCVMMGGFFLDYLHIMFHPFMTSRWIWIMLVTNGRVRICRFIWYIFLWSTHRRRSNRVFWNPPLSSGRDRLRVRQSRPADQRSSGRDLRPAADSAQRCTRRREESEPLFGCSGGENLKKKKRERDWRLFWTLAVDTHEPTLSEALHSADALM